MRMIVEAEDLDLYVDAIAAMLVFPPPLQVREIELKPGSLTFMFAMNGNEATSTVVYKHGTVQAIAKILDAMPYPTFMDGGAFLTVAAFTGGVVSTTMNIKNQSHPDNMADKAEGVDGWRDSSSKVRRNGPWLSAGAHLISWDKSIIYLANFSSIYFC